VPAFSSAPSQSGIEPGRLLSAPRWVLFCRSKEIKVQDICSLSQGASESLRYRVLGYSGCGVTRWL